MRAAAFVLALVAGASGAPAHAAGGAHRCGVAPLSAAQRHAGALAVERYHALRRYEFGPGLMGFRYGPRLGPPSARERRNIRESKRFRHDFRLNPSTLLIRRLLRTHGRGVDHLRGGTGVPLAAEEVRDLAFYDRVFDAVTRLGRFQDRCLPRSSAGTYVYSRRNGIHVGALFTANVQQHRRQMLRRFRYGALLRVGRARYTTKYLLRLQERVADDDALLRDHGIVIGGTDVDAERNRVEVELRRGGVSGRAFLRDRYGGALRVI